MTCAQRRSVARSADWCRDAGSVVAAAAEHRIEIERKLWHLVRPLARMRAAIVIAVLRAGQAPCKTGATGKWVKETS